MSYFEWCFLFVFCFGRREGPVLVGNASKERRLASCYSASLSSQVFTQPFNQTPDRYINRMKEIQLNLL